MLVKNRSAIFVLAAALLAMAAGAAAQAPIFSPESQQRAEALLKQMTLDEKVGQLNQSAGVVMPMLGSQKPDDLITQGKVGSILWLIDVKEINRLQHMAVEKSRLHIPILFGFDVIHGYRTVFPVPLAMASSWDPSVEEAAQRYAAADARAAGIQWTFTPMVDIARDARWGRIVEGAGEDPYLGSAMARGAGARIPGREARPRQRAGMRETLRGLRRGRGRARLRLVLHPRRAVPQRVPGAVPCRRTGGRGQLHERLHGPERCPRDRQSLAAYRYSPQGVGLQGIRGVGRVRGGQPRDPRLCGRPRRRGLQGHQRGPEHGHGQPDLYEKSRRAGEGRQGAGGGDRQGGAAHSRAQV